MSQSLEKLSKELMPLSYDDMGLLSGGFADVGPAFSSARDSNNDTCTGNATCVNNGTCSGNSTCKRNGICSNHSGRCIANGNSEADNNTQNNPCISTGVGGIAPEI